jgi:hypothetical protein
LLGVHSLNVPLDAVLSLGLVATHIADKHVIRPGRTFPVLCLHLQDKQGVFCITADSGLLPSLTVLVLKHKVLPNNKTA